MTATASRLDASPEGALGHDALLRELLATVRDEALLRSSELERHALGNDASHFLYTPQAVVVAPDADAVAAVFRTSARTGVPVTLRSGGTSLSGQAVTDGILVDVRRHFSRVDVLDDGARVRVQPGVTVRMLNTRLARYGRKFGPDPASEIACTIGGVVANNSSGMACGTVENAYRTLESLTLVLPSGRIIDTGAPDADAALRAQEPDLHDGLLRLRDRIRANPASVAKLEAQFSMKNTMGYGLNSFLDFDTASDILAHLVIGSEGTLGFVAEAVFRTVPLRTRNSAALLVFDDLVAANRALPALVESGAATLELLDATSLRVGQALPDTPEAIAALQVETQAALLVEYQSTDVEELGSLVEAGRTAIGRLRLAAPAELTTDPMARAKLWKLRKGLYTSVAGARPSGTTALLEDIVVPVASLADTCLELTTLFDRYAYRDSVIFGHAKDGNVHFMLTDRFESDEQLGRYSAFTEAMVDLVLGNGGSLKAEHGTGRVMAPYVRRQYGDELYAVMREVKRLADPSGILNPGVILDDDPDAHLRHIKLAPQVEEEVDRCVECGYCEPICPSRDLTLTPRQRIVSRRAMRRAELAGDAALAAALDDQYEYAGIETCAVDGLCGTSCPVLIDTGQLTRRLRRETVAAPVRGVWSVAGKGWNATTRIASTVMTVADALPAPLVEGASKLSRVVLPKDYVPGWTRDLPAGGKVRSRRTALPSTATADTLAVYLPACVNTMFGPAGGGTGVQWSLEQLCERAGVKLAVPREIDGLCCGTPWSSKGLPGGYAAMSERVVSVVRAATDDGRLPVVCDASSCTEGILKMLTKAAAAGTAPAIRVIDAIEFVDRYVLPSLPAGERIATLTVHPTCSTTHLGINDNLAHVADAVAEHVHVPENWGCCAFAGDRGMLHPELTASATAREAAEVRAVASEAHASTNRTCELGMTRATGSDYRHVLELLEEVTRR